MICQFQASRSTKPRLHSQSFDFVPTFTFPQRPSDLFENLPGLTGPRMPATWSIEEFLPSWSVKVPTLSLAV